VTWYSKLLSIIFLLGVVPVLTFYIGMRYENAISILKSNKQYYPASSSGVLKNKNLPDGFACSDPRPDINPLYEKEYAYDWNITPSMPEKATLSCNQGQITFSGTVNQIIKLSDHPEYAVYNEGETDGFGSVWSGSWKTDSPDYNSDGYHDFASFVSSSGVVPSAIVFLFDPSAKKFVYSSEASGVLSGGTNPAN